MKSHNLILIIAFLAAMTQFAGCSRGNVRPTSDTAAPPPIGSSASGASATVAVEQGPPPPESMGPEAPLGPFPAADYSPPSDGYVLVLGPGLARTFAYIGVLRELENRKIAIHGIVGVETGAMIGALWASSNANSLEWEIHRFKRETLLDVPLFSFRRGAAEGKALLEFLEKSLKVDSLQKMKVPTVIASAVKGSDVVLLEGNGSAKDIIRGAMSIPGIIKPYLWDGKERETAALETPFPVERAKALGVGKVLCVDVVGRGDNFSPKEVVEEQLATLMRSVAAIARRQFKDCDAVLSIPADGISYLAFDAKADLINRGRTAVRKWLEPQK